MSRQLRGVYLFGDDWADACSRIAAALLVLPVGTGVDGLTALRLHGVDLGEAAPLRFVTTHPHPVRRPEVRVRRTSVAPRLVTVDDLPALGAEDAFVAAALYLDLVELVSAGDWLVRLGLTTPEALVRPRRPPPDAGLVRLDERLGWCARGWTPCRRRGSDWLSSLPGFPSPT